MRRLLLWIHLWLGLLLCVPLAIIGLTGSVLVFQHELEALLDPPPARRAAAGEPRPVGEVLAAARAAAPSGFVPVTYRAPEEPGGLASVRLAPASRAALGSGGVEALVDPVSLEVLARPRRPGSTWLGLVHRLHANLLVRGRAGRQAVGWLGVVMLGLGVTGFVLWWPRGGRWRHAFGIARGARGARLCRDLHRAVGIWSLAVFVTVSASGVYLAFPEATGAAIRAVLPGRDLRASAEAIRVRPRDGVGAIAVDDAIALAREAVDGARLRFVALPMRPDEPVRIGLARTGNDRGAPMITVFVDPWAGRVLAVHDPLTYSVGEAVVAWQRPLHAGRGLGPVWQVLVCLSGLLPLLFAVTGVAMWWPKRHARTKAGDARRARSLAQAGDPPASCGRSAGANTPVEDALP